MNIFFHSIIVSLFVFIPTFAQKKQFLVPMNISQLAQTNDDQYFNQTLNVILHPRYVGTKKHDEIAYFIKRELDSFGFYTEFDQFSTNVPIFKKLTFTNIVAKLNPNAERYLVLACHYDSKYFPDNPNFVGAIDSGVPCAIILNLAKVLQSRLKNLRNKSDISLMLIFFDGEEAFKEWNQQDSVYGSRHLAQKLFKTTSTNLKNENIREIDKIEVLILLDLIGAKNSKFYNFFGNTQLLHRSLVNIERLLAQKKLLEGNQFQFVPKNSFAAVDDDHRPFLILNVPVLHLITVPFPEQWHKSTDTAENLDWPSINNFNKVLRIFVCEYLTKHTKDFNFRQNF